MSLIDLSQLNERNGFQKIFLHQLVNENGFVQGFNSNYDKAHAIDKKYLFEYLSKSQPKDFAKLVKVKNYEIEFIKYLREEIHKRGLLDVLRNPVKFYGAHFDMVGFKPANDFGETAKLKYESNIFSVTEELEYEIIDENSDKDQSNRGDLTLFINGIPIFWFELKNNTSGQSIKDAVKQYQKTRDPNQLIFKFKEGCLVCFAMDHDDVLFTTKLNKDETYFMPYNKGVNKRKGNPEVLNNLKTSYMWDEILTKDNILEWLGEYIVLEIKEEKTYNNKKKKTERIIFPRYHQFNEVTRIVKDVKEKGVNGQNYLVMDSPGSGKTYSIAWLAHHLASLHDSNNKNIYDSVIVITDRLVVDSQLQDAMLRIPHEEGEVTVMDDDSSSTDLSTAINSGDKIIVSTIQKFSYILAKVNPNKDKHYAIIIDECHSSTKGNYIANTTKALSAEEARAEDEANDNKDGQDDINDAIEEDIARTGKQENITFFGFSATPKKKTLERFGTKTTDEEGKVISSPFTCYSMQQAIDEGFILDVLRNYTTYDTYFHINKIIKDNPEFKKAKTQRAIYRYAMLHPTNIKQKIEIIMEHFMDHVMFLLNGDAKAMVVTDSREAAVKYKVEFDKYIEEHHIENIKALVAFTGKLKVKEYGDTEFSEAKINGMPEKETKDAFNTSEYQVLLVANKYQTGYDQPLLCAMYVDKKLTGINAVQTLGRLNRTYPGKDGNVFILDFRNSYDDIKDAFAPYYEDLNLVGETDPNKIYEFERKIDSYNLTTQYDIDEFIKITVKQNITDKEKQTWYSYLSKAQTIYNRISDDKEKKTLRKTIKMFVEGYSWINQTTVFDDPDLHKKWIFYRELSKRLSNEEGGETIDPSTLVKVSKFRQKKTKEIKVEITDIQPITITKIGNVSITISSEDLFASIDDLIKELNERFGGDYDKESTSGIIIGLIRMLGEDEEVRRRAKANNPELFRGFLKEKIDDVLFKGRNNADKFFRNMLDNDDAEEALLSYLNNIIYNEARKKIEEYTKGANDLNEQD